MKVLIVDDSVSMRQMLSVIVGGAGHECVEALNGSMALDAFGTDVDVVITDYNMPGMNGIELIHQIRSGADNRDVPILVLTTESDQGLKTEGRQAGATAWMTKPFSRETLLSALQKVSVNPTF